MNRRHLLTAFLALPVAARLRPWVRPEAEALRYVVIGQSVMLGTGPAHFVLRLRQDGRGTQTLSWAPGWRFHG